jgi:hypothetical protein
LFEVLIVDTIADEEGPGAANEGPRTGDEVAGVRVAADTASINPC